MVAGAQFLGSVHNSDKVKTWDGVMWLALS